MLKTFNCGVGFCIIVNKKNVKKIIKIFKKKESQPYEIRYISNGNKRIHLLNKIKW